MTRFTVPGEFQCSIDGCTGRVLGRGWCQKHYSRWWRHGEPTLARKSQPETEPQKFVREAANTATDECIFWPFSKFRTGYGRYTQKDKRLAAHREVCRIAHGNPPSGLIHAAHSCGERLCVNPRHLRWATPKENEQDKISHGRSLRGSNHSNARLTEADVRAIRASSDPIGQLSERYGLSAAHTEAVKNGRKWRWLK